MPVVISGTTGIVNPDGSAGTPSLAGSDTNTGVFFPAADTVAIATGGTEAMRVNSSQNVGIGTSSPGTRLDVQHSTTSVLAQFKNTSSSNQNGNVSAVNDAGTALRMQVFGSAAGSYGMLSAGSPAIYTSASELNFAADNASGVIKFSTGSSVPERARIDSSGNFFVNATAQSGDAPNNTGIMAQTVGNIKIRVATNSQPALQFYSPSGGTGSPVGSVTAGASSTSYNTSSDYRLKENIAPMTGALAKVVALKPCTYTWKNTGEADEGFIAHELAEVCPSAVTGEKDAVDAEGNPIYQGIDTSFLVATLTAAIQELTAKLDAAEARIAALEAK